MIERDLGLDDASAPIERRLEVAGALVHALLDRPARDRPADRAELLAMFEGLALPAAVLDAKHAPRRTNAAWRALFGARGGAFARAQVDEVLRTGAAIHLAEVEAEVEVALALGGRPARCAATLRPLRGRGRATTGVLVLCALTADEVIARELG